MALMEGSIELKHRGRSNNNYFEGRATPIWTDALEETQYALVRLENKLKTLEKLQESHLLRPTLDDSTEQETNIDILTQDISKVGTPFYKLYPLYENWLGLFFPPGKQYRSFFLKVL